MMEALGVIVAAIAGLKMNLKLKTLNLFITLFLFTVAAM
jgi:uncharacterized membrane protein YccC